MIREIVLGSLSVAMGLLVGFKADWPTGGLLIVIGVLVVTGSLWLQREITL